MRKTWAQKLDSGNAPHTAIMDRPFAGVPAGAKLFIATPMMVKEFIEGIPKGESVSVAEMREQMAAANGADATCPLSTGIFVRIASEAAYETVQHGGDTGKITPFWRMIEPSSTLAKKLTCGPDYIRDMRRAEGIE